jgi:tetratricopeptide (TPR) repeat protein
MSYTIQQIEQLNFDEFKEKPEDLISLAKQLVNIKKFEKAISILEKAIHLAKDKYGKEDALECANFYYQYANAIIRKLTEGEELFGTNGEAEGDAGTKEQTNVNEEDDIKIENVDVNIEKVKNTSTKGVNHINNNSADNENHNNYNNIECVKVEEHDEAEHSDDEEAEDGEEEEQAEAISDEQYAFENLAFAEEIYKTYLSEYDDKPSEELSDDVKKVYSDYADIYYKYGELEMCKSDFPNAIEFFKKALEIRNKHQSKFSREIAELYWMMASVYDFDSRKCLLCYYKTKVILEYHLKQELNANNLPQAEKIKINEDDLNLETIDQDKIIFYKDVIENLGENVSEEIAEFVDLISQIYLKVNFYLTLD